MAHNKTISVALLLSTLVVVVAVVPAPEPPDLLRGWCAEECSKEQPKDPIYDKHCADFCVISTKQSLRAYKGATDPPVEKFNAMCNEGCSKEFKEDPATNKKCIDSCIVYAKEVKEYFAKGGTIGAPAGA
uniref:Uncharacterized protein n=1 Tax=Oryza punctata TaxID=4537 RepID=A0A0E0LQS7_ORYPU